MTLRTRNPVFKVMTFLKSNIGKPAHLKNKVTIAQEEKYLTYGMVLCLVTLTDLARVCQLQLSLFIRAT